MTEYRAKGAAIKFPMIRHHDLGERLSATDDRVAPFLSPENEADPAKGPDTLAPRDAGQPRHTATT